MRVYTHTRLALLVQTRRCRDSTTVMVSTYVHMRTPVGLYEPCNVNAYQACRNIRLELSNEDGGIIEATIDGLPIGRVSREHETRLSRLAQVKSCRLAANNLSGQQTFHGSTYLKADVEFMRVLFWDEGEMLYISELHVSNAGQDEK